MSFSKIIDEQILKAIEAGEFDNLENAGKPLDLTAYFAMPEDVRVGHQLLKSNKIAPMEVDMLREAGQLREKIAAMPESDERAALSRKLQEKELALSLILERNRRRR